MLATHPVQNPLHELKEALKIAKLTEVVSC